MPLNCSICSSLTTHARLLTSNLAIIRVGSDKRSYTLHKDLLCARSTYLADKLSGQPSKSAHDSAQASDDENEDDDEDDANADADKGSNTLTLPETDEQAFDLFVRWLYSSSLPRPDSEDAIGPLLDAYFLSQHLHLPALTATVLEHIRSWYAETDTFPALRRVQYVYENTPLQDPLRALVLGSVARYLVITLPAQSGGKFVGRFPDHWDTALRRDGTLAVDLLLEVQRWRVSGEAVPDVRLEPEAAQRLIMAGPEGVDEDGRGEEEREEERDEGLEQSGEGEQEEENDVTDIKLEEDDGDELANGVSHDEEDN